MKVIIAGSRNLNDPKLVEKAIQKAGYDLKEIVSGGYKGIDTLAIEYALKNKINLYVIFAQWRLFGKRAGPIRNHQMAAYADALIAIWDGESYGTQDMIRSAKARGLCISVYKV